MWIIWLEPSALPEHRVLNVRVCIWYGVWNTCMHVFSISIAYKRFEDYLRGGKCLSLSLTPVTEIIVRANVHSPQQVPGGSFGLVSQVLHTGTTRLPFMDLDLPISIDIYTIGSTPCSPTFGAGLASGAFDFVGMTSATTDGISRALAGGPDTHAMDFLFCRLVTESPGTFDVNSFISAKSCISREIVLGEFDGGGEMVGASAKFYLAEWQLPH